MSHRYIVNKNYPAIFDGFSDVDWNNILGDFFLLLVIFLH